MKLTRETLSTAAYAIGKRMQGYTLLKNPKGSNPNDVNMLKTSFGIDWNHADDVFRYTKLQRQKRNGKTVITKKNLFSIHYMDPETKQITNKKELRYSEHQNGKLIKYGDKFDLSIEELEKRQKPQWKKSEDLFNGSNDEDLIYEQKRFKKEEMKKNHQPKISWLEKLIYPYLNGARDNSYPKSGFFKTLISNLKGGK